MCTMSIFHIFCSENNFSKNINMQRGWVINYFTNDFISQVSEVYHQSSHTMYSKDTTTNMTLFSTLSYILAIKVV